jgi:hypothetical protein
MAQADQLVDQLSALVAAFLATPSRPAAGG